MGRPLKKKDVADFFGVSIPTVDAFVREGCPITVEGSNGRAYEFDSEAVYKWLLGRDKKSGAKPKVRDLKDGDISYDEALRRKAIADAQKAELSLLKEVGQVVPIDRIAKVLSDEIGNARARLLAIPTKLRPDAQMNAATPERAKKLVAKVEELILEALTEIKSYGAKSD